MLTCLGCGVHVSPNELLCLTCGGAQDPRSSPRPPGTMADAKTLRGTLVVIDDDADLREVVVRMMSDQGYDMAQARDGTEGLRLIDDRKPGLVLLDIKMPGLSGLDVLNMLKAKHSPVRVVVMSGVSDMATMLACDKAGACDFLMKPFSRTQLLDMVKSHFSSAAR